MSIERGRDGSTKRRHGNRHKRHLSIRSGHRDASVPIGKVALFSVLVPLAIPMLAVFSIQIPIKTLLGQLLKVLVSKAVHFTGIGVA